MYFLKQLICIFISATAFGLIFNIKRSRIIYVALGGTLTCFIFLLSEFFFDDLFIRNLFAAAFSTLYSEVMARIFRAPSTVYLIPSILSLVPGGSLYYTMNALVIGDHKLFRQHAQDTIYTSLGIAVGIIIISVSVYHLYKHKVFKRR